MDTGALVLQISMESGPAPVTRISGTWAATFPDSKFGGAGTLSGGLAGSAQLIVNFSAMNVACPGQPGGVASKLPLATLVLTAGQLAGGYVVLDCPGGEIAVSRR